MSPDKDLTLRRVTRSDRPFLESVYADSRATELSATNWTEDDKIAFCKSQFEAQDSHYRKYYPTCEFFVIALKGEPVGRLYRDRRADEIRVVDIALLAAMRGQGIGGEVMRQILKEAAEANLMVRIHVEATNPARRLYERLGFRLVEKGDVYDLLSWNGQTF